MGIRILDGRRINDCNVPGAVLYESVSMLAYPFIFNNGQSAERFLQTYPDFGDLSYQEQYDRFTEWQRSGGTSRLLATEVTLPNPIDELIADLPPVRGDGVRKMGPGDP